MFGLNCMYFMDDPKFKIPRRCVSVRLGGSSGIHKPLRAILLYIHRTKVRLIARST